MSTEVATTADLLEVIRTGDLPDTDSPERTALRIIAQVLGAPTLEEAFQSGGSTAAKDLVGVPLVLEDVMLMRGEIEDAALPVYVLLACRDADGRQMVVNSGAARLMGQALYARENEHLPLKVSVVELAAAKPGQNAPLGLAVL